MVQARSAEGEREKRQASRDESSANDKHLCLISVIVMEGPDKSYQETGSKERQTGNSSRTRRMFPEQELYADLYSELFAE